MNELLALFDPQQVAVLNAVREVLLADPKALEVKEQPQE